MLRTLPLTALLLVAACSSFEMRDSKDAPSSSDADTTAGTEPIDSGGVSPTFSAPADADWYAIDAHLDVVGGEILLGPDTWLRVTLVDATLAALCEHTVDITAAESVTPLPEPSDFGWWRLALADGEPDHESCPEWAARALRLGVGPYDARLDPALAAAETPTEPSPYGDALYGLYVQESDGGPLYVVGVVTMPGLLDADLVSVAPLTDGTYEAHSLVLLTFADG